MLNPICKYCMLENNCKDQCYIKNNEVNFLLSSKLASIKWINLTKRVNIPKYFSYNKDEKYELQEELYIISSADNYRVVYAPLISRLYLIPESIAVFSPDKFEIKKQFRSEAVKSGLMLSEKELFELKKAAEYIPDECKNIRIAFSSGCSLDCRYCYADPNTKRDEIDISRLRTYFDHLIDNNTIPNKIELHGNGEPTFRPAEFKQVVTLIRDKFPDAFVTVQSNGQFGTEIADFILSHDLKPGFSIDGPSFIQDKQRPCVNPDLSSSKRLMKNINYFKEKGIGVGTVCTVTRYSVNFMHEIYDFFKELGVRRINVNPLILAGRSDLDNDDLTDFNRPAGLKKFTECFFELLQKGFHDGITVYSRFFSSIHLVPKSYRCESVLGKNIYLPDDNIVACSEALQKDKTLTASPFYLGSVSAAGMNLNPKRVTDLRKRTIQNIDKCRTCFLKWNCCGGCLADSYIASRNILQPIEEDCLYKKELAFKYIDFLGKEMNRYYLAE